MQKAEQVHGRDLGDVGEHDDRRHRETPSTDPPDPRPERFGAPGEGRSAVGGVARELPVGERHQQHRDERDHEHRRRFAVHRRDHVAERRGQTVGGRHCRQSDDHVAQQSDRPGPQSLVARLDLGVKLLCHAVITPYDVAQWFVKTMVPAESVRGDGANRRRIGGIDSEYAIFVRFDEAKDFRRAQGFGVCAGRLGRARPDRFWPAQKVGEGCGVVVGRWPLGVRPAQKVGEGFFPRVVCSSLGSFAGKRRGVGEEFFPRHFFRVFWELSAAARVNRRRELGEELRAGRREVGERRGGWCWGGRAAAGGLDGALTCAETRGNDPSSGFRPFLG